MTWLPEWGEPLAEAAWLAAIRFASQYLRILSATSTRSSVPIDFRPRRLAGPLVAARRLASSAVIAESSFRFSWFSSRNAP